MRKYIIRPLILTALLFAVLLPFIGIGINGGFFLAAVTFGSAVLGLALILFGSYIIDRILTFIMWGSK